jgi:hypothetical protein
VSRPRFQTPEQRAARLIETAPENLERAIAEQIGEAVAGLLEMVGKPATCRGCGVAIWFVKLPSDKLCPFDRNGLSHFVTCEHAAEFRKEPRNEKIQR